ncbi:MAG: PorP/SprF family type IX secretion system membrane protein [Flavobacteriaceae bacterium]
MPKTLPLLLILLGSSILFAQEVRLPVDIRQHNLTTYNASLFNPVFSLDRNNPQSIAVWARWQWQSIDADPTTIFLNYTRKLNDKSAASVGFFQHNTGIFFNTGGVLNYAHTLELSSLVKLSFGANLFGFQQNLADTRFQTDPQIILPQQQATNDFILQFAPGINLSVENFSFGLASENLFDYNFASKESNTLASDKIFLAMVSYDLPISIGSDPTAFLRPSFYLRTIPLLDNQIGLSTLFSTTKYWGQLGYNNFYGISVGGGGTFFNKVSLGALIEFGTNASINSKNPSFELVASYFLGKPEDRRKEVRYVVEAEILKTIAEEKTEKPVKPAENVDSTIDEEKQKKEAEKLEKKKAREDAAQEKVLAREKRKDAIAAVKREKEVLAERKKIEEKQAKVDREQAKKAEALAAAEKLKDEKKQAATKAKESEAIAVSAKQEQEHKRDSINKIERTKIEAAKKQDKEKRTKEQEKADQPQAGEKYEEVIAEDGLEPGYYLIANVFGTKKYFDAFMKDLTNKGLEPKSFYRSRNKYNYAYLGRYATMAEARKARDNKLGGKYPEKTWIYRVVAD